MTLFSCVHIVVSFWLCCVQMTPFWLCGHIVVSFCWLCCLQMTVWLCAHIVVSFCWLYVIQITLSVCAPTLLSVYVSCVVYRSFCLALRRHCCQFMLAVLCRDDSFLLFAHIVVSFCWLCCVQTTLSGCVSTLLSVSDVRTVIYIFITTNSIMNYFQFSDLHMAQYYLSSHRTYKEGLLFELLGSISINS